MTNTRQATSGHPAKENPDAAPSTPAGQTHERD